MAASWNGIKRIGKSGRRKSDVAYTNVETICQKVGILIAPVGEMEGFDKNITKRKDWVYDAIKYHDLASNLDLEEARGFVKK